MQSRPNDQIQPLNKSVEKIVSAMKLKERYIEEENTSALDDASENIRKNLLGFEALFSSTKEPGALDQNAIRLTDAQVQLFEKVIEDANLGIESHSLKVVRDSIRDLESFRERVANS